MPKSIHRAAVIGDLLRIRDYLDEPNADINIRDPYNGTLLHSAVYGNRFEVISFLLMRSGIDVNARDYYGSTPLNSAVANGNLQICERFLAVPGIAVNIGDFFQKPPIYWATVQGNIPLMTLLLSHPSIEINSQDANGLSSLAAALVHRQYNSALLLLDANGIDDSLADEQHRTPLYWAVQNGLHDVVRRLLRNRALSVEQSTPSGPILLHTATVREQPEILDDLISFFIETKL